MYCFSLLLSFDINDHLILLHSHSLESDLLYILIRIIFVNENSGVFNLRNERVRSFYIIHIIPSGMVSGVFSAATQQRRKKEYY